MKLQKRMSISTIVLKNNLLQDVCFFFFFYSIFFFYSLNTNQPLTVASTLDQVRGTIVSFSIRIFFLFSFFFFFFFFFLFFFSCHHGIMVCSTTHKKRSDWPISNECKNPAQMILFALHSSIFLRKLLCYNIYNL